MSLTFVEQPPTGLTYTPEADEVAAKMTPETVQHVAEIFNTPLTGAYNWDYTSADKKLRRLYRLGKELNWNSDTLLDWSQTFPKDRMPVAEGMSPLTGYPEFEALDEQGQLDFAWHNHCWILSQFLHGEQGALLVASQLCSCAPTYDAKLYAASQTFDEARHVEVFTRYLQEKVGFMYPVNPHLKSLLDKVLTDPRWDLKFIGMQIIIEGLAMASFGVLKQVTQDPFLDRLLEYVLKDEARHVAFGVTYLEQFVKSLTEEEKAERAQFAYEACVVMRERLVPTEVYAHFGFDVKTAGHHAFNAQLLSDFRSLLFTRIIPNLGRIGLLTDNVRPLYDDLGILQYETLRNDADIDWAVLSQPN